MHTERYVAFCSPSWHWWHGDLDCGTRESATVAKNHDDNKHSLFIVVVFYVCRMFVCLDSIGIYAEGSAHTLTETDYYITTLSRPIDGDNGCIIQMVN